MKTDFHNKDFALFASKLQTASQEFNYIGISENIKEHIYRLVCQETSLMFNSRPKNSVKGKDLGFAFSYKLY